jgi:hypothetical protein
MRRMAHVLVLVTGVAAFGVVGAGPVTAAPPTMERIAVDDDFTDEFLSEACGLEVTGTAQGHVTIRTFADNGKTGLLGLGTVNIGFTFSAEGNSVRFRNVGADRLRRAPDGTLILSIIGQAPGEFTGVLKINAETGEVLHEPQNSRADDVQRLCEALTA